MKSPEDDCDINLFAEEVNAHFIFFFKELCIGEWWVSLMHNHEDSDLIPGHSGGGFSFRLVSLLPVGVLNLASLFPDLNLLFMVVLVEYL